MAGAPVVVNGWEIYAHPLFLDQFEEMIAAVEVARAQDPSGYKGRREAKLLAAVLKVAFEVIPQDPTRPIYRQGTTLGPQHKHWFRIKFLQQYRLFFRFQTSDTRKVIVLAWVNDAESLRAYGTRSDAYAVFRRMLDRGHPPGDWSKLIEAAGQASARSRLARAIGEME